MLAEVSDVSAFTQKALFYFYINLYSKINSEVKKS